MAKSDQQKSVQKKGKSSPKKAIARTPAPRDKKGKKLTGWKRRAVLHPKYGPATITCGCGNVIHTRSTREKITVEICSKCHPFFTGKQKFVDSAGRVERFRRKWGSWDEKEKKGES